jgi:hypothetical protein
MKKCNSIRKNRDLRRNSRDVSYLTPKRLYLSHEYFDAKRVSRDERWPSNSRLILGVG